MARRPTVDPKLADCIEQLDRLLRIEHNDASPRIRAATEELLDALKEEPRPVSVEIARQIGRLDELLRGEFSYNFQYHITVDGKTVAAANVPAASNAPDNRIKPKNKRKH